MEKSSKSTSSFSKEKKTSEANKAGWQRTGERIRNPVFNDFQMISPKQVMFSYYINLYRKKFNISQREMADVCSLYGKPHNVKVTAQDIYFYESYKRIPTPQKFQVIMDTMNLDPTCL